MGHLKLKTHDGSVRLNDLRGDRTADSRTADRFLAERAVRIIYRSKEIEAWLVECSAIGIGLVTPIEMTAGEMFQLKLATGHHSSLRYQVKHCTKLWDRAHQVGALRDPKSEGPDGAALLESLLAPEPPPQCS